MNKISNRVGVHPTFKLTRRALFTKTAAFGTFVALGNLVFPQGAFAETPKSGGKLVAGVKGGSTTDTLDPTIMPSTVPLYNSYQFGNRLLERTPDGGLGPELAESWEAQEGAKRWVFRLRQDVKFHNGKEFTAADMAYSLNRHRGPHTKSGAAELMKGIRDIQPTGSHELSVMLDAPDVNLPFLMTNAQLVAQPQGEDPQKGIGTGPYILDNAEPGVRYRYRRNPNYFRAGLPHFDGVDILVINDDTARMSALLAGTVQIATDVAPLFVARLKNSSAVKIDSTASTKFYNFVMRCDQPPFDNKDLRLALKYAVDRDLILRNLLAGYGSVGNDHPLNSSYPLFSDDLPKHTFDPEKARFHYKKSGHSGPVTLHSSDGAFPGAVNAAETFQQSAAKAGITVDIVRAPADGYWSNVWMQKPFCASYFGSLATEDQALTQPYASGSNWNDAYWKRPEFDKLLLDARSEQDLARRKALYRDAALMVHDDGGHITLAFADAITGLAQNLQGFVGDHFHGEAKNFERCWFGV